MKQINQNSVQLRQAAESRLGLKIMSFVQPNPGENLLYELMHELRVHQIELEMQNEALRQSQIDLEKSRDRYVDFYDFSLVGYLTLNHEALIENINLPGAALLGVERSKLSLRRFAAFVAPPDQNLWHQHFLAVLKNDCKQNCQLTLQQADGTLVKVMLICQRLENPDGKSGLRIVLSDTSERS